MNTYFLIKAVHIVSATVLFGTGLGIANFMFVGCRSILSAERKFAARMTVRSDFLFTLPTVIVQPLSGAWLVAHDGLRWNEPWLLGSYALYLLAGLCWLPVVWIQIRMKNMLHDEARAGPFDGVTYQRLFRIWFILGWPAFGGLIVIFWLMVAKPTW